MVKRNKKGKKNAFFREMIPRCGYYLYKENEKTGSSRFSSSNIS